MTPFSFQSTEKTEIQPDISKWQQARHAVLALDRVAAIMSTKTMT